jgi:hypothetical protein
MSNFVLPKENESLVNTVPTKREGYDPVDTTVNIKSIT